MNHKRSVSQTDALLEQLFKTASFSHFLEQNKAVMHIQKFSDFLCSLCEEKGMVREHVIKRAGIERTYGHQIFRGTREPSRDKVIQIAFGFPLTVEETQRLLRAAGKSPLYPRLKRDAAILFCLNRKDNLMELQLLLDSLGLSQLGKE